MGKEKGGGNTLEKRGHVDGRKRKMKQKENWRKDEKRGLATVSSF